MTSHILAVPRDRDTQGPRYRDILISRVSVSTSSGYREWNLISSGVIRTQWFTLANSNCAAWSSELHVAASDKQGWSVAAMHCIQASKNNPKHKQWFLVAKNLFPIIRIITGGGWLYIWMALPTTGWRFFVRMNLIFEHMIHLALCKMFPIFPINKCISLIISD